MNYADIKLCDISNGPGVRISLFVSGCTHKCPGCFNEVAWDFNYGNLFTQTQIDYIIKELSKPYYCGLTLLGGEPFEHSNQLGLLPLLRQVRKAYPTLSIWCFSGYLFDEDILNNMCKKCPETKELLSYIDILVDGEFKENLKDLSLRFKGSSNQRIIMVKESINNKTIILWNGENE